MKLFTDIKRKFDENKVLIINSPSKIRGGTPPPPGGRWHEVPEEGERAGALILPQWCMP